MRFLVYEIWSILVIILLKKKGCLSQKMHNVVIGVNLFLLFFVQFLVVEFLSILYFTVVNSDQDLSVAWQGNSVAWLYEICR